MNRKHTAHILRDLPDLIYRMLSQVSSMRERINGEIAAMKVCELPPAHAHHLMVEAVKSNVLPRRRSISSTTSSCRGSLTPVSTVRPITIPHGLTAATSLLL